MDPIMGTISLQKKLNKLYTYVFSGTGCVKMGLYVISLKWDWDCRTNATMRIP